MLAYLPEFLTSPGQEVYLVSVGLSSLAAVACSVYALACAARLRYLAAREAKKWAAYQQGQRDAASRVLRMPSRRGGA